MKTNLFYVFWALTLVQTSRSQCMSGQLTFVRWSGVTVERAAPVFVYSASGEEESLAGACVARCRELPDCAGVAVMYGKGNCHGVAASKDLQMKSDNDVSYFKKTCLELPDECRGRWWALESTPGYNLNTEAPHLKVILNSTVAECYQAVFDNTGQRVFRSAQWVGAEGSYDANLIKNPDGAIGNCHLQSEDKFTEPESYRVSNYYTFYIENQCRHDYLKKIERCSYEEYYNQTLKHVEFTMKNYTKDECKSICEREDRFVCRGFTWTAAARATSSAAAAGRGLCDLHSEDLITTGSWLLRRTIAATYYRRVICLNITVECEQSNLIVTYRPRGMFRGRVYVPGRGEQCSANIAEGVVKLSLPLHGDCDVNFAHAITKGPNGVVNRTMAYVMVMVQNNPIIQTAGDRWVRVGCSPGARAPTHVDATLAVSDNARPTLASEASVAPSPAAASAVYSSSTAPLTMYVVRAESGAPQAGAVSLGEPLELRIETTDDNEIEAYHLVASSRLGDSSVLLLDSRGCPTGQVDFPAFSRSRPGGEGGVQRLSARFKAFRFPTSHVVRFALMVRFCDGRCTKPNCMSQQNRSTRETNDTTYELGDEATPAAVKPSPPWMPETGSDGGRGGGGVVAQGGNIACGSEGSLPMELEMVVGSKDILSGETLVRADHRAAYPEESDSRAVVCVHELLLVALALAWLAVQLLLLLGCCVLVNRYRSLAETNMQKDYQAFDNMGFDTVSTHRRVHWPDQNIDILHAN